MRPAIHRDSLHLLKPLRYDGIRWADDKGQSREETPHRLIRSGLGSAYTLDVVASGHILAILALHGSIFEPRGFLSTDPKKSKTAFEEIRYFVVGLW